VLGYKKLDELRAIVAPYTVRRTREEVLPDLPDRVDNNFFVEMTAPQTKAYNEFQETVARIAAKAKKRPLSPKERQILLNCLVKMRIICNALALHDKEIPPKDHEKTSPKLRELGQILSDQIGINGNKALVFSQWSGMLSLTEPVIRRLGLGYVKLTGDVPSAKRGDLIKHFFEDPDCRVFLSTDAGGLGLNLQAASLVINLDLPWNPAVLEQRIARAYRHGQKKSVQVVNLVAQGTIEERMLDTLAGKRHVFAGVFGAEEAPDTIDFQDTGQTILKQLDELLGEPAKVELALEPTAPEVTEKESPVPTLEGFTDGGHREGKSGADSRRLHRPAPHPSSGSSPPGPQGPDGGWNPGGLEWGTCGISTGHRIGPNRVFYPGYPQAPFDGGGRLPGPYGYALNWVC